MREFYFLDGRDGIAYDGTRNPVTEYTKGAVLAFNKEYDKAVMWVDAQCRVIYLKSHVDYAKAPRLMVNIHPLELSGIYPDKYILEDKIVCKLYNNFRHKEEILEIINDSWQSCGP